MNWKFIRICIIILTSFALSACVQPYEPVQGGDVSNRTLGLDLSVRCVKPATKADDPTYIAGEQQYHENTLKHIDWFIFVSNASSATAVMHGRESWTDKADVTELFLAKSLNMDNYVSANGRSGYVYVIANLPEEYTHDGTAGIKRTIGETTTTIGLTLSDLQSISLKTNFDLYHLTDNTDYTSATFDPQDSFVMDSQLLPFTLSDTNPITRVDAWLTRVASKITLDIDLASAVDEIEANIVNGRDTNFVSYLRTWYPDLNKIEIYLSYGNGVSTLLGTPKIYTSSEFFTYNRYTFDASVTQNTNTQPIKYYPTPIDQEGYPPHQPADMFYHKVEGTPFYTYPIKWETSDTHAPFIKIIIPWKAYKETPTMVPHNYIKHNEPDATNPYHVGDTVSVVTRNKSVEDNSNEGGRKEFYYKINIPDNDLTVLRNHWYKIKLDVGVLGSRDDDLSTTLSGKYYVVDWGDPGVASGGALLQGRYLGVPVKEYTMSGIEDLRIPVNSSHAVSAQILTREYYYNGAWRTVPRRIGNTGSDYRPRGFRGQNLRGTVSPNGRVSVDFHDALNRNINADLDCYPLRFTVVISHADDPSLNETVVITQYPSIFVDSKPGGNSMVEGYYGDVDGNYLYRGNTTGWSGDNTYPSGNYPNGTIRSGRSRDARSHIPVPYGRIATSNTGNDAQPDMTVITISSFTNTSKYYTINGKTGRFEYLIADPREPSGFSTVDYYNYSTNSAERGPLMPYYNGTDNVQWGEKAEKIMVGNRTTPNFIAPKFIIASKWGRLGDNAGPEESGRYAMERRCATYQEAGYPAGRWRLPTEAEVSFIANLQALQFINRLFSTTGYPWTADGEALEVNGASVTLRAAGGNSVRCVYDAWYWGDEPVPEAYSQTTQSYSIYTIGVK